jgi:hypothetical protein
MSGTSGTHQLRPQGSYTLAVRASVSRSATSTAFSAVADAHGRPGTNGSRTTIAAVRGLLCVEYIFRGIDIMMCCAFIAQRAARHTINLL